MPLCQGKLDIPNTISFPFLYNITSFLGSKITYSYHKNKWEKRRHTFLSSYVKTYLVCISLHYHWQQRCHVFLIQSKEVFAFFSPARHQFHFITYKCQWQEGVFLKQSFKKGKEEKSFCVLLDFWMDILYMSLIWQYHNNHDNSHLSLLYFPFSQRAFIVLIYFSPRMWWDLGWNKSWRCSFSAKGANGIRKQK